jgi:hypothetical protein
MKILSISILMVTLFTGMNNRGNPLDLPTNQDPKGYALLIGLKDIDYEAYRKKYKKEFSSEATSGVPKDLKNMKSILSSQFYEITELTDKDATSKGMLAAITKIGSRIAPDDFFILYYSGHGDQLKDKNFDEKSGFDQAYVTYDDYTLDDSIQVKLIKYFTKTRNVMVVDACHSSSLYKLFIDFPVGINKIGGRSTFDYSTEEAFEKEVNAKSDCKYDQTLDIAAPYRLIYFGASADNSSASGTSLGGALTRTMKKIYDEATQINENWSFYDYPKYACEISQRIVNSQRLQYHEIGDIEKKFKNSQPFKIN